MEYPPTRFHGVTGLRHIRSGDNPWVCVALLLEMLDSSKIHHFRRRLLANISLASSSIFCLLSHEVIGSGKRDQRIPREWRM
jgi:hypothetical protein